MPDNFKLILGHMTLFNLFAGCAKNLEILLAEELAHFGAENIKQTVAGVHFQGTLETAYRACLWSRLANTILLELGEFEALDKTELYNAVGTIEWYRHLSSTGSLWIDVTGKHSQMNNTLFIAQKAKDAIIDQLRTPEGQRPTISQTQPDIHLHIHCQNDQIRLALNLAGESLHRRGYRLDSGKAPLKETLAAAILYRAGWPELLKHNNAILLDPMCGTGTLIIEAALIAYDIAPGIYRKHFGFLGWKQHQPHTWQVLLQEAQDRQSKGLTREDIFIFGRDHHPQAIKKSLLNIERAGLNKKIDLALQDCREVKLPLMDKIPGLIVTNPPYGERLETGDTDKLEHLFTQFGQHLQQNFMNWKMAIISSTESNIIKKIGFRTSKHYALFNGALPCKLYCFDLTDDKVMRFETSHQKQERIIQTVLEQGLSAQAQMFANRLKKNFKHLKKWRQREGVECFRVYDADLPEYAFAIDLYTTYAARGSQRFTTWAYLQEYEPGKTVDPLKAEQRRRDVLAVIFKELSIPAQHIVAKTRRRQRGKSQYEKQAQTNQFHIIRENQAHLWVNFEDYLDTGLFLDHQLVRERLAQLSPGKRVLNLFAYTCSASVQAAINGATSVTSVDLSNTYLEWGIRNFKLNHLPLAQHAFIQADCISWLEACREQYDVIFFNPPTFSNSKRMENTWDVQRDHHQLINQVMQNLKSDGYLLFSCNQRNFKLDTALQTQFQCVDISKQTLRADFSSQANRHHVWLITHANDK